MAIYFEVLVTYDIEDNKSRKKLFDELKDMGLISIQKSVFWGNLKMAEIKILPHLFSKYCAGHDKAFFVKAPLSKEILSNSFGYKEEEFVERKFIYV